MDQQPQRNQQQNQLHSLQLNLDQRQQQNQKLKCPPRLLLLAASYHCGLNVEVESIFIPFFLKFTLFYITIFFPGQGWTGGTNCGSSAQCVVTNQWYSQCLPITVPNTLPLYSQCGGKLGVDLLSESC